VWRKNAHCAGSLRIIISGRSLCWPWHLPPSHMGGNQGSLLAPSRVLNALKVDWQRHVLASTAPFSYSRWTDRAKGSPASRTRLSGSRTSARHTTGPIVTSRARTSLTAPSPYRSGRCLGGSGSISAMVWPRRSDGDEGSFRIGAHRSTSS
jgi:hypothetical protein